MGTAPEGKKRRKKPESRDCMLHLRPGTLQAHLSQFTPGREAKYTYNKTEDIP